jgi:hypothetical protein
MLAEGGATIRTDVGRAEMQFSVSNLDSVSNRTTIAEETKKDRPVSKAFAGTDRRAQSALDSPMNVTLPRSPK